MSAHRRPLVRAALGALLVLPAVALTTAGPAAAADDDVTWTVRTASNDFGSDRTGFTYAVEPGASVDDALVVANHGDEPLDLAVYAADGYTTDAGQFDVLTAGTDSAHLGTWLQTAADSVTIEPGATAELPFTVAVPADATPGDYAGAVVTSLTQPDEADGISVDRRLGIRVDLRVGGELAPALAVEDPRVTYTGTPNPAGTGDATVTYTLHNTGNTVISAQQTVAVSGPFGWFRAAAADVPTTPELLPGDRWEVSVPVDGVVPSVRLGADVTVVPVMTDAAGSTSAIAAVDAAARTWAVPWAALVLLLLLVGAVVLARRLAVRRRRTRAAREEQRVEERVAAALREREDAGTRSGA
ncbi:WxL protein peptidoglycan domain-containing protein [Cellulomonas sp. Marseille-Q8402]